MLSKWQLLLLIVVSYFIVKFLERSVKSCRHIIISFSAFTFAEGLFLYI